MHMPNRLSTYTGSPEPRHWAKACEIIRYATDTQREHVLSAYRYYRHHNSHDKAVFAAMEVGGIIVNYVLANLGTATLKDYMEYLTNWEEEFEESYQAFQALIVEALIEQAGIAERERNR